MDSNKKSMWVEFAQVQAWTLSLLVIDHYFLHLALIPYLIVAFVPVYVVALQFPLFYLHCRVFFLITRYARYLYDEGRIRECRRVLAVAEWLGKHLFNRLDLAWIEQTRAALQEKINREP